MSKRKRKCKQKAENSPAPEKPRRMMGRILATGAAVLLVAAATAYGIIDHISNYQRRHIERIYNARLIGFSAEEMEVIEDALEMVEARLPGFSDHLELVFKKISLREGRFGLAKTNYGHTLDEISDTHDFEDISAERNKLMRLFNQATSEEILVRDFGKFISLYGQLIGTFDPGTEDTWDVVFMSGNSRGEEYMEHIIHELSHLIIQEYHSRSFNARAIDAFTGEGWVSDYADGGGMSNAVKALEIGEEKIRFLTEVIDRHPELDAYRPVLAGIKDKNLKSMAYHCIAEDMAETLKHMIMGKEPRDYNSVVMNKVDFMNDYLLRAGFAKSGLVIPSRRKE